MTHLRFFFALLLSVAAAAEVSAQDAWLFRSPSPTGNRVASFAYGNGLFVGVGEFGEIVTSADGLAWTPRDSGTTDFFTRVLFDGTRFVALTSSTFYFSNDGLVWTHQSTPAPLTDIAFGNGLYVALANPEVGASRRRLFSSTDAVTWTQRDITEDPQRVLFAHGTFVASAGSGRVLTSTDAVTWRSVVVDATANSSGYFAAGNDRFLLCYGSTNYLSSDGLAWEEVTQAIALPNQINTRVPYLGMQSSLGFAGGFFYLQQSRYASDAYAQYRSADGRTWTRLSPSLYNFDFTTLASGGGISVATEVTYGYALVNQDAHVIHRSTDGLNWVTATKSLTTPFASDTYGMPRPVYGLGRFFYGGQASPDGITWARSAFQPTHAAGDFAFRIVAEQGAITVRLSSDGLVSTPIDVKIPEPRAVAYGAGVYVMIGNGALSTSTDGATWTPRPVPVTTAFNAILYAFNRFIVAGDNATLLTSADGLTWTAADPAPYAKLNLKLLAASATRLLVYGQPTAADATAGTATLPGDIPVTVTFAHPFTSLACLGDTFLGAAVPSAGSSGYVPVDNELWKSTDGATWTRVPLRLAPVDRSFFSTYGYPVLAVGNGSALLSARVGPFISTTRTYNALLQTTLATATPVAPTITYAPLATSVRRGESATFAVGVTGTGPFTYQWKHDGVVLAGATAPTLTLNLVDDPDAGRYTVVVTNAAGSVESVPATLVVAPAVPLQITQQPLSGEVANYFPLTLSVAVSGSGPVTYQWRRNGSAISGAVGTTCTITASPPWQDNAVGDYDVVITAPHSTVTSQIAHVAWGGLTTSITPSGQIRVPVGASVSVTASATGAHPPFTYQWGLQSGPDLPGATGALLTLTNVQGPRTDSYAAIVRDSAGHHEYVNFQLIVVPDGSATMSLTSQPVSQAVVAGGTVHLSVTAPAGSNYRYQWRRYSQPIPGATSATLDLANFASANNGQYDVIVYQNDYSAAIVSQAAYVAVGSAHLSNLSALGYAGTGEETFFQGFVFTGTMYRDVPVGPIVRSIGPGLIRLGVEGVLPDPQLSIVDNSHTELAANDDWSVAPTGRGLPATVSEMAALGAFALDPGARDSALKLPTPYGGLFHVQTSGTGGTTGYVLNEIYAPDFPTLRLSNLSARSRVGDRPLIAGFVIAGEVPLRVLIRGVGPSLAAQGVTHPLANPKITLYDAHGTAIHNNDQWTDARNLADLRAATAAVGAFALTEGSNDAVMLETLDPGVYSVHVTSVDGSPGIALVEIYEVP